MPPEIDFTSLDDHQFESLIFDVMKAEGYQNLDWIDGAADGGRDIVADTLDKDASGHIDKNQWVCDAKFYKSKGVPWEKIHPTLAHADARKPDFVLFAAYPHLTPPCKEDLERWKEKNRPSFKIRYWERKEIEERLLKHPEILRKHLPQAWSEQLEMEAYLREATLVLANFARRVPVIWNTVEGRPFSDTLRLKHSGGQDIVFSHPQKITDAERAFLRALLRANEHLLALGKKAFNIPEDVVLVPVTRANHPDDLFVLPMPYFQVVREDIRRGIEVAMAEVQKSYQDLKSQGIVAITTTWKPYQEKNRVALYVVFASDQVADR